MQDEVWFKNRRFTAVLQPLCLKLGSREVAPCRDAVMRTVSRVELGRRAAVESLNPIISKKIDP